MRVILFGGTGKLGQAILKLLSADRFDVTVVIRESAQDKLVFGHATRYVQANVLKPTSLEGICQDHDIVISTLGKRVSLFDRSPESFREVDLEGNRNILRAATGHVRKFVYVSAFHAEKYTRLEYFRTHHVFATELIASGLDYSIIKPPALFGAFEDVITLARKGRLVNLGNGHCRTNPVSELDVARACLDSIAQPNTTIEIGGKEILTRRQINRLVQDHIKPGRKLFTVPLWLPGLLLPLIRLYDRNAFDKLAFYLQVLKEDVIAPQLGDRKLNDFLGECIDEMN